MPLKKQRNWTPTTSVPLTDPTEASQPAATSKGKQFRFSVSDRIVMCRVILVNPPSEAGYGQMVKHWGDMLSDFKAAIGTHLDTLSLSSFQWHFTDMMLTFKMDE